MVVFYFTFFSFREFLVEAGSEIEPFAFFRIVPPDVKWPRVKRPSTTPPGVGPLGWRSPRDQFERVRVCSDLERCMCRALMVVWNPVEGFGCGCNAVEEDTKMNLHAEPSRLNDPL